MTERIVIVGAGEAGMRAAFALREAGFAGTVTLIGEEPHGPYERPPLSKAALVGEDEPTPVFIATEDRLAEHRIAHHRSRRVTAIDRPGHAVIADGERIPYDRLLLATGAMPRRLTVPGADAVLYLRRFDDALALRPRLRPGSRVAVIGGGFIGLELAAAARARGATVTVIEAAPRLLSRAVPERLATALRERHEAEGVTIRLGARIERIDGTTVRLEDGETIAADMILAGIGAVPETQLAESAGLAIDNGIAVDGRLATSDPDIFAAGDCCSFPHPLYGGRRLRLEAWRNAQDHGNSAARSLLGGDEPHAVVPWFWSDQYDATLQIAGLPDEGVETVERAIGGATLLFHLAADGRLVAASALGPNSAIARDIRLAEMLIERRASPPRGALADPAIKLKSLLSTP